MSQLLLMLDSVDVVQFHGLHFDALAGYVPPSSWPDFSLECRDYPDLYKLHKIESITPSAADDAAIIDCEWGDATPSQIPPWLDRQLRRGVWRPGVYAGLSTWEAGLLKSLEHYGSKIRRWVADWTYHQELLPGYDAQQFTNHWMGRNVDASMVLPSFFPSTSQPTPTNGLHYHWYDVHSRHTPWGPRIERNVIEHYDAKRIHTSNHHELAQLEAECRWFAQRTVNVARHLHPKPNGHANWAHDHLGWRHIHLARRSQGQQYVK